MLPASHVPPPLRLASTGVGQHVSCGILKTCWTHGPPRRILVCDVWSVTATVPDPHLPGVRILSLAHRSQSLRRELARAFSALHPRQCSRRDFVYTVPTQQRMCRRKSVLFLPRCFLTLIPVSVSSCLAFFVLSCPQNDLAVPVSAPAFDMYLSHPAD